MGKRKKRKNNSTPRRKRYKRKNRLEVAKRWIPTYEGKNIVKGYAKWFGVDKICAVTELEMLGYSFGDSYKHKLEEEQHQKTEKKRKRKEKGEELEEPIFDHDEHFAMIVDYTPGGSPIGLTWEEWERIEEDEQNLSDEDFYDEMLLDPLLHHQRELSHLEDKNIMLVEAEKDSRENTHENLEQLFELFIQWKAGNFSSDEMWTILKSETKRKVNF